MPKLSFFALGRRCLGMRHALEVLALIAVALILDSRPCVAQSTLTWDNNGSTAPNPNDGAGTWNNQSNLNWWDGTTNVMWNNSNNDIAAFGIGGAAGTVTVSGSINAGGLVFNATNGTTAYTLSGGSIVVASGAFVDMKDGSSGVGPRITINSALTANNLTIRNSSGTTFGLINLGGSNTLSGTLTLQGNTTSGAGLFVSATTAAALNGASSVAVMTNTSLSLAAAAGTNWTQNFTLTGTGSSTRGAIRVDSGTAASTTQLSGAITLGSNGAALYANPNVVVNISGNIGDGGSNFALDVGSASSAAVVMILSGNNTFTGGLKIDGGEIRMGSAGALNSTAPNLVTFTNNSLAKTLSLNGTSVTAQGLVSSGGTGAIAVQNASNTAATLTLSNTGNNGYGGTLGDGTGNGALSLVENGAATQTLSGGVSLTGTISVSSGGLNISGAVSAASGLLVNGGTLTLSGPNTYAAATGGTVLTSGTLNINNATALGTSTLTINGGFIDNTSAAAIALSNNNAQVWNGDFTFTGTKSLNLGTGAVSLGTAAGTARTITVNGGASTLLTVGGAISDGATATAITKGGSGTLVLGGPNNFSGVFTVNLGILNIQNNLALGTTAGGTVIADGAKLQVQNSITVTGESLTTGFLESVSGNNVWTGNITGPAATQFTLTSDTGAGLTITGNVNANGHTMIVNGGGSGEISGAISGVFNPGGLNMNGTGTWVLSGPNTYTAPTVVNSGNLQVGKAGAGQTGTLTVTVSSTGKLSGSGSIIGAATVTGTVSPGDSGGSSTGQLSFKSGLTFNPSTVTTSALLNLTNGASGDNIHITGAVTLNSNSNFVVTFDPGYSVNGGDTWTLMDWTGLLTLGGFNTGTNLRSGANVGNEGNLDLPDLSQFPGYSGQVWQISTLTDGSTGGALTITVVPEPGHTMLLLLGAWSLGRRRRRRSV